MVKGHAPRLVARIERRIPHQTWKDSTGPRSDILSLETAIAHTEFPPPLPFTILAVEPPWRNAVA